MENQVLIGILVTVCISWAAWISVFAIQTNQKANKSLSNDESNQKEITAIGDRWDSTAKSLNDKFDKVESRLDMFINQELNLLKQMAQK